MDFSKNAVSSQRVHGLFNQLSALNKEHSAKIHHQDSKEAKAEPRQFSESQKLPKISVAEMITRLRMGKPITETPKDKIKIHNRDFNRRRNFQSALERRQLKANNYQQPNSVKDHNFDLNQAMRNLSDTRKNLIENIIKHNSANDSVEDMLKNRFLLKELTGANLERQEHTLEQERARERARERVRMRSRMRARQRTR